MKQFFGTLAFWGCLSLSLTAGQASAYAAELGSFGAWYAMTSGEGGEKLCYAISGPQVSLGRFPTAARLG